MLFMTRTHTAKVAGARAWTSILYTARAIGKGLLLALVACSGAEPARPPPDKPQPVAVAEDPAADEVLVIVMGDSIAAGYGLPSDQAFPDLLQARLREAGLPVRVLNAGVSGDTTAGGVSRLAWLLKQRPDLLVVELGGNDLLRGQPVENTRANLEQILTQAKAAGARVVLLGVKAPDTHGPAYQAAFDAIYPELAKAHDVAVVEGFLDPLVGRPELLQADGLHPTADGHRLLADTLQPALEPLVRAIAQESE